MDYLERWRAHFEANRRKVEVIESADDELSDREKRVIGGSIAAFQLGEYSEGKGLLRAAEQFALSICDERLVEITKLFIAEEQRHALLLRGFMLRHGIPLLKRHWADVVFRRLRKSVGFELSITVLITAEIISLVYYRALRECTGCGRLRAICEGILADERAHVNYESGLISWIREGQPLIFRRLVELMHGVLFAGTVLVVCVGHREVLADGGFGFVRFWNTCWEEYSACFAAGGRASEAIVVSSGYKPRTDG